MQRAHPALDVRVRVLGVVPAEGRAQVGDRVPRADAGARELDEEGLRPVRAVEVIDLAAVGAEEEAPARQLAGLVGAGALGGGGAP